MLYKSPSRRCCCKRLSCKKTEPPFPQFLSFSSHHPMQAGCLWFQWIPTSEQWQRHSKKLKICRNFKGWKTCNWMLDQAALVALSGSKKGLEVDFWRHKTQVSQSSLVYCYCFSKVIAISIWFCFWKSTVWWSDLATKCHKSWFTKLK